MQRDAAVKCRMFLTEKAQGFLLVSHHCDKCVGSQQWQEEGVVSPKLFLEGWPRALGPGSSSEKCSVGKSSCLPEIFVTIQDQHCFSAEINV